ncbi:hypothetical protein TBLA_0E02020 [Henningerozyma blattae CBS 6284]|uniref:SPIN90/Ldb17 leucine-rich domain-containing protein n=1 Tax=Henningerozyma blattae (strain ATCC 34711 / CBS 6284 / DSM 70876 / NBRC 10599 / NRRL Y-10934 / UCD 77-7) TaxID=1071380 RepID=I2H4F3_HENB6|nr:hypothetical protein TBLA_0E02020 [Tetrapisispora blattae CBS 6284]CCH61255.1 hypothetical protein TBLA_0E02020 [Tetrapisispora blattae CBS 6284]
MPEGNPNIHTKQEIIEFWNSIESLLTIKDEISDQEANTVLVAYITRASKSFHDFLKTDRDLYRMVLTLTESDLWLKTRQFCISKLLSLLNVDLLDMQMKFTIVYILLWEAKQNLDSLDLMLEYQGFNVFYNTLYTQFAYLQKYPTKSQDNDNNNNMDQEISDIEISIIDEMKKISTFLMDLLFIIFKYNKCQVANIQIIDDFFIYFLINTVRSDLTDDLYNNALFKLILSLNEQYIIIARTYEIDNKIFKYLISHTSNSMEFIELLLLKFNRMMDRPLQIMMCKILYSIFTCTDDNISFNFFYLNDLNVFVDVLIRELQNISDSQEILRNTFLRVMIPLLNNTELSKTHYRKDDIIEVLTSLTNIDNICSNDKPTTEQLTTVRLANKCFAKVAWLETIPPNTNTKNSSLKELKIFSPVTSSLPSPTNNLILIPPPLTSSRSSSVSGMSLRSMDNSNMQFYNNDVFDSSAESLTTRKNRPPPPPPPSRKRFTTR